MVISICFIFVLEAFPQEEKDPILPWPELKGYVKYLSNATSINLPAYEEFLTNQLIHHRLNIRWDVANNLTLHAGWRNQIFFGEQVKASSDFGNILLNGQDDFFSLSTNFVDSESIVFNSTLDRLYAEYYWGNLEISLGRQRVNWGINTIWNPNDIFNTFSFVDFDYEERPGSDVGLLRYYIGEVSSIEVAAKFHGNKEEMVIGGLWKFNSHEYDFQILTGYANGYFALGAGWAGNLGNAGWKGEYTWFVSDLIEVDNTFLITSGVDYSFSNGWYINGGFLFNKNGSGSSSIAELATFNVSAQNIYPYKYAILLTNSYPVTPLSSISLTVVYTPNSLHPMFLSPVVTYSIAQDWDLDFTGQIGLEKNEGYYSPLQAFFLRLKWSY
jgi:hypothetical protein